MSWQDLINGTFELGASLAILNHIRVVLKQKCVKGVSIASGVFFTIWGFWNVYYYPHLDQTASFVAGVLVVVANCVWVGLLLYYRDR